MKVLVIGATGRQGGAVTRRLAASGHHVRALTRTPGSPAARDLAALGADVVQGDLRDPGSLRRALAGAGAVFAMTVAGDDPAREAADGAAVVAAVRDLGTPLLVYSSAALADQHTAVPSIDAKAQVEQLVLSAGPAHLVLAPAGFYEMLLLPQSLAALAGGTLIDGLPASLPVPALALDDYARIVESALTDPAVLPARRTDLACDAPTRAGMASALSAVLARPVGYHQLPPEAVRQISGQWHALLDWMIRAEPRVDTTLPARLWPQHQWQTFAAWAATPAVASQLRAGSRPGQASQ
jgi:uncharacterized protein YbjT (DUF2867 family)